MFQLEHSERLFAALARRPHVRALVSGHVHTPFVLERDGLLLLGAPAVCVPFRHGEDGDLTIGEGGPTGARVIFLCDDGSMTSEVIEA